MVKRYLSGMFAALGFALSCGFVLALTATAPAAPINPQFEILKPPKTDSTLIADTSADITASMKCAAFSATDGNRRNVDVHYLKTHPVSGESYNAKAVQIMRVTSYAHSRASPIPWRC